MQQEKFGLTASWAFSLILLFGCGGGSSGDDKPSAAQAKDACVKVCQKLSSCQGFALDCNGACAENNANMAGAIPPGCNTNDTLNKVQACVNGTCPALEQCLDNATSACSSSTGGSGNSTGGGTGTGGTGSSTGGGTGTGGTGSSTGGTTSVGGAGSGDCSICTKANACCLAFFAQQGMATAACAMFTTATCTDAGAAQSSTIMGCQAVLAAGVSANIAACR